MKQRQFQVLCKAVAAGKDLFLENTENDHAGKAVVCRGEEIEVDIYGKREVWPAEQCRQMEPPDFDYHR